ncbi:MAG: YceI family protein [Gammaproteobacteria bacterium]|nr:YceI family protein [Gammaproteobacteria bacterium]MDD9896105.1 YceI family protein [Gammaproteobacteria bacterium]MDD9959124.1 YceI family protein [Gammaproteobacteria bacterium]
MNLNKVSTAILILVSMIAASASAQQGGEESASYSIDSESSILRVFVGRAGPMARMGHNHVVHTTDLIGQVNLAANAEDSTATFAFPVSSFVVDDQGERDRAASEMREGFDTQPGRRAIEGTRENMLSEGVLNGTAFTTIAARISTLSVADDEWSFAIALDIVGSTVNLELPARVDVNGSTVTVDASFSLNHEDLGLSVFTALGGALSVAEQLDFELHIEATEE